MSQAQRAPTATIDMSGFTWKAHPALRCALAYASGIVFANIVDASLALLVLAAAAVMFACLCMPRASLGGASMIVLVCAAGAISAHTRAIRRVFPHEAVDIAGAECVGIVSRSANIAGGRAEFYMEVDSIVLRNAVARVRASIVVRLRDTSSIVLRSLQAGDRVGVRGTVRAPRSAVAPGSFDERAYLASREVMLTLTTADARDVYRFARGARSPAEMFVDDVRSRMAEFSATYVRGREGEIVEALLSGDRSGIDRETRSAFATTGTLHVLAVSGLHVAVLAMALAVMASWIPNRWAQLAIFISVLCAYTIVTGAGASIVRASFMAAAFMLARVLGRRTRSLNVLAAAALVLLVADPFAIYDVGFQLSFAAVAGIVLFQARWMGAICDRFEIVRTSTPTQWVARSFAMTLSAQLLTAPILLVHFGSVPLTGLVLNLVVVPLTSCAMAAAFLGVAMMPVPLAASMMGATAFAATHAAVALVEWGSGVPLASIQLEPLSWPVAGICLAFVVWAAAARNSSSSAVRLAVALVVAVGAIVTSEELSRSSCAEIPRAYLVPSGRACVAVIVRGDSAIVVANDSGAIDASSAAVETLMRRSRASERKDVLIGAAALDGGMESSSRLTQARIATVMVIDRATVPVRLADDAGIAMLVFGLDQRLDEMIAFEWRTQWRRVQWR